AGFLVLSEVPDAETLWLISTGTGIAPFLSILRTEAPWRRFRNVVLVHAVRHAKELVYRDLILEISRKQK
ncbi:MAG: ferredoxin--NADP(+) reductase, partial [Betaproteobacteria bacterium]